MAPPAQIHLQDSGEITPPRNRARNFELSLPPATAASADLTRYFFTSKITPSLCKPP